MFRVKWRCRSLEENSLSQEDHRRNGVQLWWPAPGQQRLSHYTQMDWCAQENEQSNKNEFKEILPTELQELRDSSCNTGNHSGSWHSIPKDIIKWLFMMPLKTPLLGAGKMAQRLRDQLPVPTSDGSQPFITEAPWDPTPSSDFSGYLCSHAHTPTQTHAHIYS